MLISPLDRKLLRDLWHMRSLAAAIAVVMGCGVALFILSRSLLHSLEITQGAYYERYRFADVFASVKRAPDALIDRIAALPGVSIAERRIVAPVNLSVPGLDEPASGRLISVPDRGQPRLNRLYLRRGRWLAPGSDDEVLASEAFVNASELDVGDLFSAVINGRMKRLRIVGVVLSPEYIYEIKPGDMVPDNRHFGVFWMNEEALSMAYDMDGAFNDLSLKLMRGAAVEDVIERVDQLLEPYGGLGAYARLDQMSHQFVNNEIEQNRNMGLFAPSIFLGVSAFLLNVVMSRTISSQREQIAALKAFGYSAFEVGWHYVKFVLLIVAASLIVGLPAGAWFGSIVTGMYARLFHFPEFTYRTPFITLLAAAGVSATASVLGAMSSVIRAVRLPPAEAMRPEPPANFGPTLLERMNLGHLVPPVLLMIVRQLERRPVKTAFSTLAVALAVAVLVIGNFFQDSIDYMMNAQFHWVQRYDMSVSAAEQVAPRALHELASMPGVLRAEPVRAVSAKLRAGPRSRRVGVLGIRPDNELFGLINMDGTETPLPPRGLLVSQKLAEVLGVGVGDEVEMEVLVDKRPVARMKIAATLNDFAGLRAFVDVDELHSIMLEGPVVTGVHLLVDPAHQDRLYRELKETPRIATVMVKQHSIDSFNDTIAKNLGVMKRINLIFACIIAAGVVYNSARISLAERSRELATLRVIGFTRGEISSILLGELAIVTLLAIPLGFFLGRSFAWWMVAAFDQELFRFPMVVTRRTYAWAALVVMAASAVSGLIVRRNLDHLDLVAVLKSANEQATIDGNKLPEPRMRTLVRRVALMALLAGLAAAVVYGMWPAPVDADLAEVVRGAIRETVDQEGKTRIRERYIVSAPLAGRLARIDLDNGDRVQAGETILASIEPRDPELLDARARKQAEANVEAAQARVARTAPLLEEAIANAEYAQGELKRLEQARAQEPGVVTQSEIDNGQMMVRTRSALVRSARHAQDIAAFELAQAQAALLRSTPQPDAAPPPAADGSAPRAPYPEPADAWRFTIPAPINGRVLRVLKESATVVTPGEPLIEIGDPQDLEIEIDVLSRDAVRIAPGAPVILEQWGGERPLNGEVRLVEPSGFTKISTLGVEEQRVNVIVDLVDPPHEREKLNDGFRVEARIVVAQAADVLKAPTSALFRVGDDWAVFRVEDGVARQRVVKVGLQNGLEAEIKAGLAAGDAVVTHPGDNVVDGVRVRPR